MLNNVIETAGFALAIAFLWFVWPPLVLLGAGLLLVAHANTRQSTGRLSAVLGAAAAAARRAYAASREQQPAQLQRVA